MQIKTTRYNEYWYYNIINEDEYTQEQYDYIFKYLDFDKLDRDSFAFFTDTETAKWFKETHINSDCLNIIYNKSPEGYKWLKNNWGKGFFWVGLINSIDKQELKMIVNKVINIELIRSK